MALKNNFYEEIFTNEKKWIEMINKNFINNIYCTLDLKPFYVKKREEILTEYEKTNNLILGQILEAINNIIKKIDEFDLEYKNSRYVNIESLLPLFLINQMNNNLNQKGEQKNQELGNQNDSLKTQAHNYARSNELEDYVYDDFPLDNKKVM